MGVPVYLESAAVPTFENKVTIGAYIRRMPIFVGCLYYESLCMVKYESSNGDLVHLHLSLSWASTGYRGDAKECCHTDGVWPELSGAI